MVCTLEHQSVGTGPRKPVVTGSLHGISVENASKTLLAVIGDAKDRVAILGPRMASRTAQKQQARQRRVAEEHSRTERARRERRLRMLGGVVLVAAALVAVAIAISIGGGSS